MSAVLPQVVRLGTSWPSGAAGRGLPVLARQDQFDGGGYFLAGTVQIDATPDVPVSRRVRLFDSLSGRLVRETWSAADGAYSFTKIRAGTYFVTAHDHTLEHGAVIRDRIEAVPMVTAP